MENIREIIRKFGCGFPKSECKHCKMPCHKRVDQSYSAIMKVIGEAMPPQKLTYENREIKVGKHYYKEVDARYNAGFNGAIAQFNQNLQGEDKGVGGG